MPNRVKDIYALFAALALLMVLFMSPQARADDAPAANQPGDGGTWRFRVYLDDQEIGYHHFHLAGTGDHRQLRSEARFEYRLLFLKLFDYEHENLETWSGDCLQSIRSRTDANGDLYAVEGRLTQSGFRIEAGEEAGSLPDCVMTFAYWNPDFLAQSRLLNSQDGTFVDVQVSSPERDERLVGGEPRPAMRYRLKAGEMQLDLWYSDEQEWLALESEVEGGRTLRYERIAPGESS
jgi:hypothetical protein